MAFLLAALVLGFLGSFHCIGMCGPIALALPIHQAKPLKKILLVISYNFGRIATYSIFGIAAGFAGRLVVISGFQQTLSIALGSLILLSLLFSARFSRITVFQSMLYSFFNRIKTNLKKLFSKNGIAPLFSIGLLNGLLPCGLVYVGFAGAMASGNSLKGLLFMATFGLGTLPAMLLLSLLGGFISLKSRNNIRRTVPLMVGFMAILLILRGLNLGIPYVSPKVLQCGEVNCCHGSNSKSYPKAVGRCFSPKLYKKSL